MNDFEYLHDKNKIDWRRRGTAKFKEKLKKEPVDRLPDMQCIVISVTFAELDFLFEKINVN